jgi:hypothetical protein
VTVEPPLPLNFRDAANVRVGDFDFDDDFTDPDAVLYTCVDCVSCVPDSDGTTSECTAAAVVAFALALEVLCVVDNKWTFSIK